MHIAGDQHQVAGRCPIISTQNDPLGRTRPQYFLAFAPCNCLMQTCHVIGRTLTSRHLNRMDGWEVSVLDRTPLSLGAAPQAKTSREFDWLSPERLLPGALRCFSSTITTANQ